MGPAKWAQKQQIYIGEITPLLGVISSQLLTDIRPFIGVIIITFIDS